MAYVQFAHGGKCAGAGNSRAMLRLIGGGSNGVILAIADIQSVFHHTEIAGWTGAVIADEALEAVETAVKDLFEL